MQLKGGILELLILDQLSDQIPARILFLCFFIRWLLVDRQEIAALDVNEVRRHDDELSGDLKVQHPKSFEILKILAGDAFDRNIVNIDLVLLDQVEQQVERTFENFQLHFVIAFHQSEVRNVMITGSGPASLRISMIAKVIFQLFNRSN